MDLCRATALLGLPLCDTSIEYNFRMVVLAQKSELAPENPLRGRAHRHSDVSGASRCSKPNRRVHLREATYDESYRLESCSRDPIGYEGSPWNLFEFVDSRPIIYVDPTGHSSLVGCLKSPALLACCIRTGVVQLGDLAKKFCTGKNMGPKIVDQIVKFGGTVIKGGGKGSHQKVKTPWGKIETVPKNPGTGLCKRFMKDLFNWASNQ